MGGRFGKYGDMKRKAALRKSRKTKGRLKHPATRLFPWVEGFLTDLRAFDPRHPHDLAEFYATQYR